MLARAALLAVLLAVVAAPAARADVRWGPCAGLDGVHCATVPVPLDEAGAVPGRIGLRAAHLDMGGPASRPLLYLSGGPGDGGVEELLDVVFTAPELAREFDLYGFDQRGTGRSGLLRCPALERDPRLRSPAAGADCARRLGDRARFYTTAASVADVEAVRAAIGQPKITLLGISYGTQLALAYARAHPDRVDRLVLDSVVDPDDTDPFARDGYAAIGPSLAALCPDRCRGVSADPAADLAALTARLRDAPMRGAVYDEQGRRSERTLTPVALSDLLFDADYAPATRAGVPAAVRAALVHRDAAPLLRLIAAAEPLAALPGPSQFSSARYAASCEETPMPWDPAAPLAQREAQAQARVAALGPGAFAPFDFGVVRADLIDLCLRWPGAGRFAPTGPARYPALPTLILQGGEDLRTPPASSEHVAAAIPGATRVVVPGVGHAVLSADPSACGLRALVAFATERPVAPTCGRVATHVPATGIPPASLDNVAREPGLPARVGRTVGAVRATLDDLAFALSPALGSPAGGGLRGGTYRANGGRLRLRALGVVPGVRVSGGSDAGGLRLRVAGPVSGVLRLSAAGRLRGRLGSTRVSVSLRGTPGVRLAA
jgi:pimeloyl-ACP methyl ester carboxylesterase